jgi:multiple antibiotic resistance protein
MQRRNFRQGPSLSASFSLFVATFTTMLALINPLEAMPIFLGLTEGKSRTEQLGVAKRACLYALGLMFFFLICGPLLLKAFGVPLAMIRVVGGIVLMKIGFELFSPTPGASPVSSSGSGQGDVAFAPLAMPIMFGPGGMAAILGMTSTIRADADKLAPFIAIAGALVATMFITYATLARANDIVKHIGAAGLDAMTKIVGFFVAAMGGGLIFHGTMEAIKTMTP